MERILVSGTEARLRVKEGADKLANAVKSTLGPFGTNALIEKGLRITNDGIRIAQEIMLDDELESLGASKLKEAAAKSNDQVGDGSTTIITLAQGILKESTRLLGTDKTIGGRMTTADFLRQIKNEKDEIIEKLISRSTPIESEEALINSAKVSVEDDELGTMIGSTQWQLGREGYVLSEEVPAKTTSVEFVQGIKYDNGFAASQFITNEEKQSIEIDEVRVILTTHILQTLEPLKDILDSLLKQKVRKVVIIARGYAEQAILDCAANVNNGFLIFPLNAPYTDSSQVMKDLAAVLGGTFIDYETRSLEDMQLSDVGFAKKLVARRYDTIVTGDSEQQEEKVSARVSELKDQLNGDLSDFERKTVTARVAQLENGFALIKVGADSETERKRIFDKVEDAVNAVRAAYQEGTVKGAGLEFKEIADELPDTYILKRPLLSVYEQIMVNAPSDFVIEDWVRDPVKVLRIALEQAVSVAGELSTVSVAIATKKQRYNALINNSND